MLDVLRAFSSSCLFLDKITECVHEVADWRVWEDFCFYLACVCLCVCVRGRQVWDYVMLYSFEL